MEDMDDHLQIIEHDPLAGRKSVDRGRANTVMLFQLRLDLARNRFQMRLGSSRTNNKEIGEGGNPAQIHDNDLFCFLVGSELGAEFS